ncbi:MAG: helix-turn-helix domain-containing protein [Brooklawnia sp.]|jgi:transcriptional regulator with XRE-family HTH domain
MDPALEATPDLVGERLLHLRVAHGLSLTALSEQTCVSRSTLSRLENGQRRPTLELLLMLGRIYRLSLDELIGEPRGEDSRFRPQPQWVKGKVILPLSRQPSEIRAFKIDILASLRKPRLRSHEGFDWLYVLSGHLRFILGEQERILTAGESVEFNTEVPH